MKVAFDEHIPPPVLPTVRALLDRDAAGIFEIVSAHDYADPPATSDVPWVRKFHKDGGKAIISGDIRMRSKPHERAAIAELGFIVIFLPAPWNEWKFNLECGYIVIWWEIMIDLLRSSKRRDFWQLPNSMEPDIKRVKNVTGP